MRVFWVRGCYSLKSEGVSIGRKRRVSSELLELLGPARGQRWIQRREAAGAHGIESGELLLVDSHRMTIATISGVDAPPVQVDLPLRWVLISERFLR